MKKSIYSVNNKTLTTIIKRERNAKGISQKELGKRLNKYQSFISKVETGERVLDTIEFIQMVKKLKSNPEKLFKELLNNFVDED